LLLHDGLEPRRRRRDLQPGEFLKALRRVGKGAQAPCPPFVHPRMNGGHAALCPSYSYCSLSYFTVSAPALQATASWSPVAPLQPTAPMILPPSTSGIPPGDAVGGGES